MGDLASIPGLGRSSGEGNSYPLQDSGLENSMNCIVQGVAKIPSGDLPNPGIEPRSPTFQADSLPTEPPGKMNKLVFSYRAEVA